MSLHIGLTSEVGWRSIVEDDDTAPETSQVSMRGLYQRRDKLTVAEHLEPKRPSSPPLRKDEHMPTVPRTSRSCSGEISERPAPRARSTHHFASFTTGLPIPSLNASTEYPVLCQSITTLLPRRALASLTTGRVGIAGGFCDVKVSFEQELESTRCLPART